MTGTDIALVLGAVASLITAVAAATVTVVRGINRVQETADQTHTMVNSQRLAAARYTRVLVDALRARGIDVPDDESLS